MSTLPLFDHLVVDAPPTEGIKFAGSKLKLLPHILQLVQRTGARSVLDGFSGSSRVSQSFARLGYQVISNDTAVWSEVFGPCYLMNREPRQHYSRLIKHLDSVRPRDGWFTVNYGGEANGGSSVQRGGLKKPWQVHNCRKLDGIREEIDNPGLSSIEKAVALTSLIRALDRVDNTMGHFVSYLRHWSPRSYNLMHMEVPNLFVSKKKNEVIRADVFDVARRNVDLAYYDLPYGSNNEKMPPSRVRYASYYHYHLWTTICLNDRPPLFGKSARRRDTSDVISGSVFEQFQRAPDSGRFLAVEAIEQLIHSTAARWVLISYSSGGRATAGELNCIISDVGKCVEIIELDYQRNVMAGMKWTNEWLRDAESPNREFLFLIDKG